MLQLEYITVKLPPVPVQVSVVTLMLPLLPFAGTTAFKDVSEITVNDAALTPPNLTTDPSSRIANWSQQDFINRFRQGKKIPYSPMPWNNYKQMSDDELKAIYHFLKSLKPAKNEGAESIAKK